MSKDPKIDMPFFDDRGISEPVLVNTSKGQACVAWFNKKTGYWHDEQGNTFGDVRRWDSLPKDFEINYEYYGGLV
jgi:hypothetical protein